VNRIGRLAPIATVIVVCIALRVAALPTVETPRHDDAISYLAATGHQLEYRAIVEETAPPFGRWARAADWQRLWSLDDPFERIARGLARDDIHPPLYFWLLHLWLAAFGVTVRSGPTLNLVLSVGTLVLVYWLGRQVSGSGAAGLVAALVWGSSRAALSITLATRPYELLGLLGVAFLWQLLRVSDPGRTPAGWEPLALAAIAASGLLTHYHFALLLAAGATAAWWRLHRSPLRRQLTVLVAFTPVLLLVLLVYPYVLTALDRSEKRRLFDWGAVPTRAVKVWESIAEFGGPGWVKPIWVLTLVVAAAALVWPPNRAA
jgi:4-amino-4-deoxy-L-arabinose transferase-like glycosyltransferase